MKSRTNIKSAFLNLCSMVKKNMLESELSWLKPLAGLFPCELIITLGKTYHKLSIFCLLFSHPDMNLADMISLLPFYNVYVQIMLLKFSQQPNISIRIERTGIRCVQTVLSQNIIFDGIAFNKLLSWVHTTDKED